MIVFELISEIEDTETIPAGGRIRDVSRLRKMYGQGRWRKLKGVGRVRLPDGSEYEAKLHWYEAHGIGRKVLIAKEGTAMNRALFACQ